MSALEHSQLLFCRQFSVFDWEKIWNSSIAFKLSVCLFFLWGFGCSLSFGVVLEVHMTEFFHLLDWTYSLSWYRQCKDGQKNFDCWFFPMFWRTKNVKFHFQWGKKRSNWKHETGNRLWHPFRTWSVSLQATNGWKICLPWNRMS